MKGFHVCKAGNAPQVGQVKSLIVSGDRIKSKKVEEGGQNYTITAVTPRDSYSDSYGNVGFDIVIEPATGQQSTQASPGRAATGNWSDDRSNRIERQHSQEMAIRTVAILMANGLVSTPEEMKVKLKELTDYYQRDVGRMPKEEPAPEPDPAEDEGVF